MTTLERIKILSKSKGISLQNIALKAGMGKNTIYKWDKQEPSFGKVAAVAKVLDVSTDYLLGKTDEEKAPSEPKHIDVEDIVNNSAMLTSRDRALSDEDRTAIRTLLEAYLNSREGQDRLRKYGGYGNDGNKTEK